jgi:hypothetical protein
MSGTSSQQKGSSATAPWKAQQPYLKDLMSQAQQLTSVPMQYYPGQTIAGFTDAQTQAQQEALTRANAGSPLLSGAQQGVQDTMSGKYLNPDSNPYLNYYTDRAFQKALPQFDNTAVAAGRYGSDAWGVGKGTTMADITGNIYGGAYNAERANQMAAYGMAPGLAAQDYADIAQKAAVGQEQQSMNQAQIDAARQKYEWGQAEPYNRLGAYQGLVTGNYGSQVAGGSSGSAISGWGKG